MFLYLLFVFLCTNSAFADRKPIVLFDANGFVDEYEEKVQKLKAGDRIVFSTGKSFVIGQPLDGSSRGNVNRIFELGKKAAIRVPVNRWAVGQSDSYRVGYQALADFSVPAPLVFAAKKGEFTIVERYERVFSLGDWFNSGFHLLDVDNQKVARDFLDFIVKTRHFSRIGDAHLGNILYTEKGWLVADWTSKHVFATSATDKFIFSGVANRFESLFDLDLKTTVIEARLADGPNQYTEARALATNEKYSRLPDGELYSGQIEFFKKSSSGSKRWFGRFEEKVNGFYKNSCRSIFGRT